MGDVKGAEVVRRWSHDPRCVGVARAELLTTLRRWGLAPLNDAAALVLSELLTNAGRHARVPRGREIETRFLLVDDGLRIEVHDASPVPPRKRAPDLEADGGRGLFIVAAVADSWGYGDRAGPGKVAWAELALPPAAGTEVRHG
ncbi:ATP-binding protein [Streptomyces sp. NPDC005794]|uniref:ATP-binding protein n=1 Tax=Streptomyces sp. NPDC005794 TaxID=3364733 RepID=UPI00368CFF32